MRARGSSGGRASSGWLTGAPQTPRFGIIRPIRRQVGASAELEAARAAGRRVLEDTNRS